MIVWRMDRVLFILADQPVRLIDAVVGAAALGFALLLVMIGVVWRGARARAVEAAAAAERQREMDDKMAELNRASAELE